MDECSARLMTEEAVGSAWKCDDHTHFPFHQMTLTALGRERETALINRGTARPLVTRPADVSLERGAIRTYGRTTPMGNSAVQHLEQKNDSRCCCRGEGSTLAVRTGGRSRWGGVVKLTRPRFVSRCEKLSSRREAFEDGRTGVTPRRASPLRLRRRDFQILLHSRFSAVAGKK